MIDGLTQRQPLLEAMSEAFARGDAAHGEVLLTRALDEGLPWDQVTSAAARGMSARYLGRRRHEARA